MTLYLDKVSLSYENGFNALRNISAQFPPGSFTALVGPSGCGKSTLLRAMAGLLRIQSGSIVAPPPGDIGFVFQEPTLMAWKSAADNIALPMKIAGFEKTEIDQRTTDALALVGLPDRANALPRQLSGGQKMRVSLARALAKRPPVLLMDEPFAALDEMTRFKLDDDLRAIWRRQNCTIVFVTHSVTEAAFLAERALVMGSGQVMTEVGIARDGDDENFRTSATFQKACADITDALGANFEAAS